jgi:hypothetical protein
LKRTLLHNKKTVESMGINKRAVSCNADASVAIDQNVFEALCGRGELFGQGKCAISSAACLE